MSRSRNQTRIGKRTSASSVVRFLHQETGESVRWLSIERVGKDGRHSFRLPCPDIELARLACVVAGDRKMLARVLRMNPGLLIFSLAEFHHQQGEPPCSGSELVSWSESNLLRVLRDSRLGWCEGELSAAGRPFSRFSKKKQVSFFRDFLRAKSNSNLRKSLSSFLEYGTELAPAVRKSWLTRIIGKQLRADDLKCRRIRRDETIQEVVALWRSGNERSGIEHSGKMRFRRGQSLDVEPLIQIAADSQALRSEFDQRLLEEKLAAMKQLAYGASHEINNPLANISTRAQTMLANELDPEKRHKLSVIYEQAIRAHEMISDMMLFAHPPALNRMSVSIRLLMRKIVTELGSVLQVCPGIELAVTIGPGVDRIDVDPVHLSVAIKNLIRNSVEAIGTSNLADRRIEVRVAYLDKSRIGISVADNGIGITSDVARHLFDPFYSGREAGRGLGFGLSKVWTIAQLHGGQLRWEARSGSGTCFVLELPSERAEGQRCIDNSGQVSKMVA